MLGWRSCSGNTHPLPSASRLSAIYPFTSPKKLAQLNCRPNSEGDLWLVSAFWGDRLEWTNRSQALLAVAELEASKDSRNIETSRMIYEKYLQTEAPA
ncbi:type IV toxin-antitoxin system AbiEi family antitoxin [Marinomonas sp. GJ51-6]|uniref:type IV toxin-antitoxin system AbiEi family antitoxin n=1 Tax=Marinomonas sp. GJ51-6 TaxID=2992802 RepID=UPI0039774EC2